MSVSLVTKNNYQNWNKNIVENRIWFIKKNDLWTTTLCKNVTYTKKNPLVK